MPHNWPNVLVHVGVAAILVAAVSLAGFPMVAMIANAIGWPMRERLQRGGTPFRLWSAVAIVRPSSGCLPISTPGPPSGKRVCWSRSFGCRRDRGSS